MAKAGRHVCLGGCGNLVWNVSEEGASLQVPPNPLFFVIPSRFIGEESAIASFSAACQSMDMKLMSS